MEIFIGQEMLAVMLYAADISVPGTCCGFEGARMETGGRTRDTRMYLRERYILYIHWGHRHALSSEETAYACLCVLSII